MECDGTDIIRRAGNDRKALKQNELLCGRIMSPLWELFQLHKDCLERVTISSKGSHQRCPVWDFCCGPEGNLRSFQTGVHEVISFECSPCLVTQSCLTLCDPLDCSPRGSSVHGILQARVLEWVAMASSRGSSQPRDRTCISWVSCTDGRVLTTSASPAWEGHFRSARVL